MLKWMLAAGAAALAITAPAQADPKGGKGGGNKDQATHVAKAQKGGGGDRQVRASQRGERVKFAQRDDKAKGGGKARTADHGDRGKNAIKVEVRGGGRDNRDNDVRIVNVDRGRDIRAMRVDRDFDGVRFVPRWNEHGLARGFINGCPPGLAKKGNGCLPPGQATKLVGTRLSTAIAANTLGWPYREWYRDNDRFMYRSDNDYIYRVDRNDGLINALFPYANRDYYYYPVGAAYPMDFNYYNVPYQYQSFYPDNGDYWYRYGDGAIYQVNPGTGLIQGIASLLTGVPLGIGQPLPPAYSTYNVPLGYRAQYFDTPDAWYRYNDGYIYRVDPTTQLVTAIIRALV
jgi:hypothetical protein